MTAAIEIYTRPGCGYCSAAKSLLDPQEGRLRRIRRRQGPGVSSGDVGSRRRRLDLSADFHWRDACRRVPTNSMPLDRQGKLDALLAGEKADS